MEHEFNRRQSDRMQAESRVRKEIIEQMSEIEDTQYRVMLGILIRMQDEMVGEIGALQLVVQGYMGRITSQLEKISKTDEQLRKEILNGHSAVHDTHHHWIDNQMKIDAHCSTVLDKHEEDGLCHVARKAIEDAKIAERRRWKIVDELASKAVWLVIGMVAYAALSGFPILSALGAK